jgi:hypothetical protein
MFDHLTIPYRSGQKPIKSRFRIAYASQYLKTEDCHRLPHNDGFSDSPPSRRNVHNSGSPSDKQMQFISKQSTTFGFSLSDSISCFSLHFPGVSFPLQGNAINITDTNFTELHRLCEEFDFTEFAVKLSEFRPSMDFSEGEAEDADARG